LSAAPLNRLVIDGLNHQFLRTGERSHGVGLMSAGPSRETIWAFPDAWSADLPVAAAQRIAYTDVVHVDSEMLLDARRDPWFVVSSGRFAAPPNWDLLERGLADAGADAVAVTVDPRLAAYQERIRLTRQGELVGYRRLYQDSMEPILVPGDWPPFLFIRSEMAEAVLDGGLPAEFPAVVERLRSCRLGLKALAVAGPVMDLETEEGLLSLCRKMLAGASFSGRRPGIRPELSSVLSTQDNGISPQSRLIGPVVWGDNVCVEPDVIVVGPSVLCRNSRVRRGAVVEASIVGIDTEVVAGQVVRNVAVTADRSAAAGGSAGGRMLRRPEPFPASGGGAFRRWGRLSYAARFKRVADVVAAVVVLALFAPIIPFIALAVKASSPGPVFYRHRRQGLRGRPFDCVKFRTMKAGADRLQDKLRSVSEVDGPQFKMADDPRITAVGRFLRETYLDEIPQFYNVLMGDMSVVGPRPSPESENTLCPWWRDARLSVRPGVTGLWQISRTREPMKDFQEWIRYDTQYVRELSLRLDLWICWRTVRKMAANFVRQF
jgi:lipopolysaccharide/colanic/teichoic acid biosynthesis glycosyltransferase